MRWSVPLAVLALSMGQGCPAPSNEKAVTIPSHGISAGTYSGTNTLRATVTSSANNGPPPNTSIEMLAVVFDGAGNILDGSELPVASGATYTTQFGTGARQETVNRVVFGTGFVEVNSSFEFLIVGANGGTTHLIGPGVNTYKQQDDGSVVYHGNVNVNGIASTGEQLTLKFEGNAILTTQ